MYSGLLIILTPLIFGYLIRFQHSPLLLTWINKLLSWMVYVILFLMGISLAFLENLGSNLFLIFQYALVFSFFICGSNLFCLYWFDRRSPWIGRQHHETLPSRIHMVLESLKLCVVVFGGFLIGLLQWSWLKMATQGSEYALIFLLFLVGIQLRNSDMSLRQILLSRRGIMIALVVACSALVGGVIAASILGLPLKTGLAMASGYGWYSLSGILLTEAYGPIIGGAAFFNDLTRELLAIILIPALVRHHRACALGLSGATSMDFTLPVLQRSGGLDLVPAAIVHGFILSLAAPVFIALFS